MLGKLTGEHKTDSSLNLTGRESRLLVVGGKLSSLAGNALEDVVDEGVHDGHTLLADTSVGVDLLEDLVDVGGVRFDALLALLLLAIGGGLDGLGRSLLGGCFSHGGNEKGRVVDEVDEINFVRGRRFWATDERISAPIFRQPV